MALADEPSLHYAYTDVKVLYKIVSSVKTSQVLRCAAKGAKKQGGKTRKEGGFRKRPFRIGENRRNLKNRRRNDGGFTGST